MSGRNKRDVEHQFEEQRFANLTKCFVCDELLENEVITGVLGHTPGLIMRQIPEQVLTNFVPKGVGCTCRVCGVNVHKSCQDKIRSPCAKVYHKFELRSYPPFSKMCYACGTTLHGLYNQGYRCSACGIDCHAGCRTNVNIKFCEAAPEAAQVLGHDESDEEEEIPVESEPLYQFVAIDPKTGEEKGKQGPPDKVSKKQQSWRNSLSKRITTAIAGGASAAVSMASSIGNNGNGSRKEKMEKGKKEAPIQIPSSLPDMGRELRKLHTQNRAVAMVSAERWEQEELPRLKLSRVDLTKHKAKLRSARDKLASKADRMARKRTAYYRQFLIKVLTKYGKMKKSEAERVADGYLDDYSKHQCREDEMLEKLMDTLPATAHDTIRKEIQTGMCKPDGKLEQTLIRLEQLHEQVQVATQSLEAVRRELFFPRWRHWFARLGLEGTYVALGTLWLEQFQGSTAVRVGMMSKTKKNTRGVPTLVIAMGGYDTVFNFDEMGESSTASKQRQKSGSGGTRLVARVEQLSVSGSALPVSFMLDQLSLDLEFFLNIEAEYIESRKRNIKGSWRIKPNTFSLKFKRFELNFKAGSLNIPDALLRTVVKNLIATLAKQTVVSALPPEFGDYLHFVDQKMPSSVRRPDGDFFRYHGRIDVTSEVDLETLDFVMESSASSPAPAKQANGLVTFTKFAVRGVGKLAASAVGANLSREAKRQLNDVPVVTRVCAALGLDQRQIDLFVRAQQELGLTKDALFPDDSLRELGMKAIYANVQDLQSTVEAANKLGMRVLAGDLLSSEAPLRTILDIVHYILTYFGPGSKQNIYIPRMIALWQGALDKTMKKMASSASFRNKLSEMGPSNSSLPSSPSAGGNALDEEDGGGFPPPPKQKVRRIIFTEFIERVLKLSRKRVITHMEIVHTDLSFGIEHFLKVGRDKMLRAAMKTRGGNAMVFQLRNTRSEEKGSEPVDAEVDDEADVDTFKMDSEMPMQETLTKLSLTTEDVEDEDEDEMKELLGDAMESAAEGATIGYGEKQRQREAQILARFEKQTKRLVYIREKLLKDIALEMGLTIGQGRFDVKMMDIDLCSPIDFRLTLASTMFSNRFRVNNWPWRRVMRAEGNDLMHMALMRIISRGEAPGSEVYTDPDSEDSLHIHFSSVNSRMESVGKPKSKFMTLTVQPEGGATNSWTDPGKMHLHWKGEEDIRFLATMDLFRLHGGLNCLQDYANDILTWSMNFADKKLVQIYQYVLRMLIRYANLNTFSGSASAKMSASTTAEDTFFRVFNASTSPTSPAVLSLELELNLVDFTDDIAHLMQAFVTDPVNLGKSKQASNPPSQSK